MAENLITPPQLSTPPRYLTGDADAIQEFISQFDVSFSFLSCFPPCPPSI
jgi:hypothetical protein